MAERLQDGSPWWSQGAEEAQPYVTAWGYYVNRSTSSGGGSAVDEASARGDEEDLSDGSTEWQPPTARMARLPLRRRGFQAPSEHDSEADETPRPSLWGGDPEGFTQPQLPSQWVGRVDDSVPQARVWRGEEVSDAASESDSSVGFTAWHEPAREHAAPVAESLAEAPRAVSAAWRDRPESKSAVVDDDESRPVSAAWRARGQGFSREKAVDSSTTPVPAPSPREEPSEPSTDTEEAASTKESAQPARKPHEYPASFITPGLRMLSSQDYASALRYYRARAKEDPSSSEGWFGQAAVALARQQARDAADLLLKGFELDPQFPVGRLITDIKHDAPEIWYIMGGELVSRRRKVAYRCADLILGEVFRSKKASETLIRRASNVRNSLRKALEQRDQRDKRKEQVAMEAATRSNTWDKKSVVFAVGIALIVGILFAEVGGMLSKPTLTEAMTAAGDAQPATQPFSIERSAQTQASAQVQAAPPQPEDPVAAQPTDSNPDAQPATQDDPSHPQKRIVYARPAIRMFKVGASPTPEATPTDDAKPSSDSDEVEQAADTGDVATPSVRPARTPASPKKRTQTAALPGEARLVIQDHQGGGFIVKMNGTPVGRTGQYPIMLLVPARTPCTITISGGSRYVPFETHVDLTPGEVRLIDVVLQTRKA